MSDDADALIIREIAGEAAGVGRTCIIMPDADELVSHDWSDPQTRTRAWTVAEETARPLARSIGANIRRERLTEPSDSPEVRSSTLREKDATQDVAPRQNEEPDPPFEDHEEPKRGFFRSLFRLR